MKKIIFLFALFFTLPVLARIGCMSNSRHLKESYDHKSYEYVACKCPCDKYRAKGLYSQNRNLCIACGHYHDPRPMTIATPSALAAAKAGNRISTLLQTPRAMLSQLITRYKKG